MLNRILDLAKIQNKLASFDKQLKEQYYDYLIHEFGVLFTYHSNRIEKANMTLTLNDTKEILNNTFNLDNIKDKNNIDIITIIKTLHQIIGNNIIENAGSYKQ